MPRKPRLTLVPESPTIRLFLRRSKSDGQENSLDVQRAGCQAFAAARGWKDLPVVEYVADGIAGDDVEGLDALRQLVAETMPGDLIICRHQDRLGRDALAVAATIRSMIEGQRARLFFASTGEEIPWRNATDMMMIVLRGFAGQVEVEEIRKRTRLTMRELAKAGFVTGGQPYGYTNKRIKHEGKSKTIAEINPAEATVVQRVFREFVAGQGYKAIATGLNDEAIPSPRGGEWDPSTIRSMLTRDRYRGLLVHGEHDRKKVGGKRIAVKADPAAVVRTEVEAWRIIDDETWLRAQEIMKARAAAPTTKSDNRSVYALSGFSKCDHCEGSIGIVGGSRAKSYGCIRHHTRGKKACPVSVRRPVAVVEAAIADTLRLVLERPDVLDALLGALRTEIEAQAPARKVNTRTMERQLAQLRREQKKIAAAVALADDIPELVAEMKRRADKMQALETRIAAARRTPDEVRASLAQAETTLRARIRDLRRALSADNERTRDFYKRLFPGGLEWTADTSGRPHRWRIRGAADVATYKREATPTGFEPVSPA